MWRGGRGRRCTLTLMESHWGTATSTGRNSQGWSPRMCLFQRHRDEQNEVVCAWQKHIPHFAECCGVRTTHVLGLINNQTMWFFKMSYSFIIFRLAKIEKLKNIKCWKWCRELESQAVLWVSMGPALLKRHLEVFPRTQCGHQKHSYTHTHTHTHTHTLVRMFFAAPFVRAENWKNLNVHQQGKG